MNAVFQNLFPLLLKFVHIFSFCAFFGRKIERKLLFRILHTLAILRVFYTRLKALQNFSFPHVLRLTNKSCYGILKKIRIWEKIMSYYEREAEKDWHFYMNCGEVGIEPHFHSAMEFTFVKSGFQEVIIGGEKRILHAGEGCFCQPFCIHSYARTDTSVCYTLVGDGRYFERHFTALGEMLPPRFFTFSDFDLLAFLFSRFSQNKKNERGRVALNEGICALLTHALFKSVEFENRKTDKQNMLVCDVLHYAHEHLDEDVSLQNLSKVFGYSDRHLSRVLSKNLSQKWNDYLHVLRARKAHELLLENPSLSVLDIALSCGFESSNTFYRAYKSVYGVPPRRETVKEN